MKNSVGFLVVTFGLLFAGYADAQVITFNELSPTDIPILASVICADGTGFRFNSNHFHLVGGTVTQDFSSNGTSHIGYESGRGFPITMQRVGPGTFSLFSLDAGEFYAVPGNERPDAQMITITGHQLGGGVVSHTVDIDGIHDGPGGVADYQHFVLPTTFVNLTSVVFTGLREGNADGGIALDNLEYQLETPETLAACVAVPQAPDTPTVAITSPVAGNVAGIVQVDATATDNVGVASVQFRLDGVDLGAADVTAPYSVTWDSNTVPDGTHTLTAEARDTSNNVATASVVVTVRNHPVPTTSPHYLDLDGVDDYLQVADANDLSFGNGTADTPLTLEAWFRPDAMVRHQLLGKWDGANTEYKLHIASGVIRLDLRDASSGAMVSAFTTASQTSLIGSWHHLAVTYDGRGGATAANGITLYVDGVAVPVTRFNSAAYVAMENLTASLQIGREGPNWKHYDGGLDELRMWNVARSHSEIQSLMTTELTGDEPGLVAYWRFNEGTGSSVSDDSPANHTATVFNGTTWVPGGPMGPPVPDTTPPDIINIVASNLTDTSIRIAFSTSEAATAWVSYTPTTTCPCTDVYSAGVGTTHVVMLTGLTQNTTYQFVVRATDGANNTQVGSTMSFTTLVTPPDSTAPTVAMLHPSPGNVAGTVQVEASATDNLGVVSVQFKLDGVNLGAPDATAPYTASWDSTTVADGPHTLTAEARDAANNVGTASVVVNVANAPVVTTPHYLDLDGVNDYLEVADANGLSFGNGTADTPLTFETWFRPDAMVRHQLLNKWDGPNAEYKLHIASGVIRLDLRDQSAGVTISAFTTASYNSLIGSWHHLAVTYDGRGGATAANGISIYIDGVSVALVRFNNAAYVAMENLAASLQIGREGPMWKQFDGGLDELRLWNVARTQSEIQSSMMTALSGVEPGLVAYWKFNEGTGTTVADDSPANHTATMFNAPAWVSGGPLP